MKYSFFNLVMKYSGFNVKCAISELHSLQKLNHLEFNEYIENQKWIQFIYYKENNIFYKNFIEGKKVDKWSDIPILKKSSIQLPLETVLTKDFKKSKIFKNNTSGSSGTPFYFAKDKWSHARTWAVIFDRYARHGIVYGQSLQARFYGIPLNGVKYYKEKIKDFIACRFRFPVFDLSEVKLNQFIEEFRRKKFEYINGYTSSLVYFANYLIEKGVVLNEICPSLKVCFPTSEMCSLTDRQVLEKGFGVKVANEYGCAEMDILAFEDENFDWIMTNENVYFEVVDDNGNIVPDGETGRLLITSLTNKAMPFIRYEIGDIVKIGGMKGNNSILLELIGRTNEFALLPSGRRVPALTFYYITKTMVQAEYGIKEFIIKQISTVDFVFEYVADEELNQKACLKIQSAMDEYLEPGLNAIFKRMAIIERSKSGKLKQFYNLIA